MAPIQRGEEDKIQFCSEYNRRIEALRQDEYPMLRDEVYLDHAGITLPAKSLMTEFAEEISSTLIGNPHSTSTSSQLSTSRIEDVRMQVLRMFNADPAQFDLVFVANATAGIKLVAEAFRAETDGFNYVYHQASHTSLVGVREEARNSVCLDDVATVDWLNSPTTHRTTLFAYPAQSNLDGRRLPLSWSHLPRKPKGSTGGGRVFTLLDAAAYVSTSPLDLSAPELAPDFIVLSFYKVFGFPDLGALIVRRQSAPILLNRRYFGGGTVDSVTSGPEQWHARKTRRVHEALEDGTLPIHSIMALDIAIRTHLRLFGTMHDVSRHTSYLQKRLHHRLKGLRHDNGKPACVIYSKEARHQDLGTGAVVAFNLQDRDGTWVSLSEFQKLASLRGFHLRTGGVCNPGGTSSALGLTPWEVQRNHAQGFRCGDENDVIQGKPTGVIRISLGAMSTESDVDKFITFLGEFYVAKSDTWAACGAVHHPQPTFDGFIEDIIVYPIKSCRGFHVPKGVSWQVRPEGLMWDREWCLVHSATGRALSLKRYPRMALLQPTIDLAAETLTVTFLGAMPSGTPPSISIPLSEEQKGPTLEWVVSRVCSDDISIRTYASHHINDFFSGALGVPCVLARFSPSDDRRGSRFGKVHQTLPSSIQEQQGYSVPGSFPVPACSTIQSPEVGGYKILLANESPILAVTTSSVRALNEVIKANGGQPVSVEVFRANIIIGSRERIPAYSEDNWSSLRAGSLNFRVLGPCQRCHMVCIDPKTGVKGAEPFVTLSKTRRFDGKIWFGVHLSVKSDGEDIMHLPVRNTLRIGSRVSEEFPKVD